MVDGYQMGSSKENDDILHSYISHCISNLPIFKSSVEYEVYAWINKVHVII